MIVGVGIDIVSISRFADKLKNRALVEKLFSLGEITYCESTAKKEQHYAARFAAKEAFLKATGKGMMMSFDLKDIELIKDESEHPTIHLRGDFQKRKTEEGWRSIHVSLSHEGDNAIAIVIIEK
ncbi:MAG TPA: holo-ACP synthase [Cyclobacteriaceae bacterium]|jgi:holo-[acyl-carrier protein] synthase|nr:holo-ACP synthase [Cyclobacteriaceae bacterium]